MRRVLGAVGRVLVTVGTLLLLFVAYQLWGTGIYQARAQDDLRSQFEKLQQGTSPPTTTGPPVSTLAPSNETPTTVGAPRPCPPKAMRSGSSPSPRSA
jgi:sortase A